MGNETEWIAHMRENCAGISFPCDSGLGLATRETDATCARLREARWWHGEGSVQDLLQPAVCGCTWGRGVLLQPQHSLAVKGAGVSAHLWSCHGDSGTVLLVLVGFSSSLWVPAGLHGFKFSLDFSSLAARFFSPSGSAELRRLQTWGQMQTHSFAQTSSLCVPRDWRFFESPSLPSSGVLFPHLLPLSLSLISVMNPLFPISRRGPDSLVKPWLTRLLSPQTAHASCLQLWLCPPATF